MLRYFYESGGNTVAGKIYHIRARCVGEEDLHTICSAIAAHWDKGRIVIRESCVSAPERRQANGLLKGGIRSLSKRLTFEFVW